MTFMSSKKITYSLIIHVMNISLKFYLNFRYGFKTEEQSGERRNTLKKVPEDQLITLIHRHAVVLQWMLMK